jgi:hypothetical protein
MLDAIFPPVSKSGKQNIFMTTGISLKKITQSDDILISEHKNTETEVN